MMPGGSALGSDGGGEDMEDLSNGPEVPHSDSERFRKAAVSGKRYWQCPGCGGIVVKNAAIPTISGSPTEQMGHVICGLCGVVSDAAAVYAGEYDLAVSDDVLLEMKAHPESVQFDEEEKRWYYRGKPIRRRS
jgi:hypothetical protein